MKISYTKNYIKIYFWQVVSLFLNFLSMFIVLPYITNKAEVFGIYSVCISVNIFLAYADLGFIGAGQKYAAEHFARGETHAEIRVMGFTSFILFLFLLLFSGSFFYLSFHPWLLIKNLTAGENSSIASSLLLILALFTPATLLQRLLQMIFGTRLEDYIVQRANIIASFIRILSVLWFFQPGEYDIVGYFLFTQLINLIASFITLGIAKKRYNYNFRLFLISMRFNKETFRKTKKLAFTSLYITISWIIYYELDPTVIGKFIGAKQVAIYSIGISLLSFFRGIFGILYSPFNNRFNHFIGVGNREGLKNLYLHIVTLLAPVVIIPILTVVLLAKPLILSWVGVNYIESVSIAQLLVLCNLFAFITYPSGILLIAQEKLSILKYLWGAVPFLYWIGIGLTYPLIGLEAFALFKLIVFGLFIVVYFNITIRFLDMGFFLLLKEIFLPILLPISLLILMLLTVRPFLPVEKSKANLLIVVGTAGILIVGTCVLQYFSSSRIRNYVAKILKQF